MASTNASFASVAPPAVQATGGMATASWVVQFFFKRTGVITKTDVVSQSSHCQAASCMAAASAVTTNAVVCCHPGDLLRDVWSLMKERHLKNISVLDQESQPIGGLNAGDALEALLEEVEYEEDLLREYVMCVSYH